MLNANAVKQLEITDVDVADYLDNEKLIATELVPEVIHQEFSLPKGFIFLYIINNIK